MPSFSVLTYNVCLNKALRDVPDVIRLYSPSVICLQEVTLGRRHSYKELLPGYNLAATTNSFYRFGKTYGQATFYKNDVFYQTGSRSIVLPKTYYELFLTMFTRKGPRTALSTDLVFRNTNTPISICNLHLTALMATNRARNKQLYEALEEIEIEDHEPLIILGDFNYPFRKKGLEKIMSEYGLKEATHNLTYTYGQFMKVMRNRMKFDFVLYRSLLPRSSRILEDFRHSDHYPVLVEFENPAAYKT